MSEAAAAGMAAAMAESRLRRKQLLSAEEAELFELAQAAGSGLDPEVFRCSSPCVPGSGCRRDPRADPPPRPPRSPPTPEGSPRTAPLRSPPPCVRRGSGPARRSPGPVPRPRRRPAEPPVAPPRGRGREAARPVPGGPARCEEGEPRPPRTAAPPARALFA
ncbi:uncharacterized protein [Patagioenas fasciata]|uniref:uncharacterized protein isoform X1 n=1 Tax=Patagioenas fasciata TaxID=372321 RepID=UPI003A997E47